MELFLKGLLHAFIPFLVAVGSAVGKRSYFFVPLQQGSDRAAKNRVELLQIDE